LDEGGKEEREEMEEGPCGANALGEGRSPHVQVALEDVEAETEPGKDHERFVERQVGDFVEQWQVFDMEEGENFLIPKLRTWIDSSEWTTWVCGRLLTIVSTDKVDANNH
jgi:hypothetical protein